MQLVSQCLEVLHAGSRLADVSNTPFGDKCGFLSGCVHGQPRALSDQPRMVLGETCLVRVFAGCNERHLIVIDQVVEELGEELGEPPHAYQIPATRVIGPLPAPLLALITLFLVIFAVKLDDLTSDFFVNHTIKCQTWVFLQLGDHKSLVLFHDSGFFSDI